MTFALLQLPKQSFEQIGEDLYVPLINNGNRLDAHVSARVVRPRTRSHEELELRLGV
jgi:hypothetical protein